MKRELTESDMNTSATGRDSNQDRDGTMINSTNTSVSTNLEEAKKNEIEADIDNGSDIDDDQLEEYQELLDELGNHAVSEKKKDKALFCMILFLLIRNVIF